MDDRRFQKRMTAFNMALVGCGTIAPTHAEALADLPADEVVLTCCSDTDPSRSLEFAEKYGLEARKFSDILADRNIDAVTVCTPSGNHGEIAIAALQAGKHVIVEKPMEISVAACDRMIHSAVAANRALSVISQHRFDPASLTAHQKIKSGAMGDILLTDARICWFRTQEYYDSGNWRGTWALDGGGCLMNQGIHTVDLMLWLCGPVKSVHAQTRTAGHRDIEVEDVAVALVTFESGAVGTVTASTAAYPGYPAQISLFGSHGSVVIDGDQIRTLAIKGEETASPQAASASAVQVASGGTRAATTESVAATEGVPAWGEAHRAQLANFIQCCRTGAKPFVDGYDGRRAVEFINAVYESARRGATVEIVSGSR